MKPTIPDATATAALLMIASHPEEGRGEQPLSSSSDGESNGLHTWRPNPTHGRFIDGQRTRRSMLLDLPPELLSHVCAMLDVQDVLRLSTVWSFDISILICAI